jgi:hypothetical protein
MEKKIEECIKAECERLYFLYLELQKSGFTEGDAFKLTNAFVSRSILQLGKEQSIEIIGEKKEEKHD